MRCCGANYPALRFHAVNHASEGIHLAKVLGAANPGDRSSEAQPEAGMRHTAIAAQIEIPLERFFREVLFVQALHQQVVVVNAPTSADDLAIAFGRKHVKSERE